MGDEVNRPEKLRAQIKAIEEVLDGLKTQLADKDPKKHAGSSRRNGLSYETSLPYKTGEFDRHMSLDADEYERYGRQMIMPEVGIRGQIHLKNKSVLIIGVGGLGCPAAAYLAGAGVGKIGLVDGDTVELSNLHRQIVHSTSTIGISKVKSAVQYLKGLNSNVQYKTYGWHLDPSNAISLFEEYDTILDCTDHPTSRYLISDAAVLARVPLVSASALKTEGQLMVLNNPAKGIHVDFERVINEPVESGHCYRCIFPKPPPAESVTTCGEGGILGPVVGVMGVLMATETIKLLLPRSKASDHDGQHQSVKSHMLLYSAFSEHPFRLVRLGGKRRECPSCSDFSTISKESLSSGSLDYAAFCGVRLPTNILPDKERISAHHYSHVRASTATPHLLVDVREKTHFDLAHLKGSINMPFSEIQTDPRASLQKLDRNIHADPTVADGTAMYFICRFGNDSQLAVQQFKEAGKFVDSFKPDFVADVKGGLDAWRRDVDPGFPNY